MNRPGEIRREPKGQNGGKPKSSFGEKAREATAVGKMRKGELKRRLLKFKGSFKMDFTEEYLDKLSEDRLRHILLAAIINAKKPRNGG